MKQPGRPPHKSGGTYQAGMRLDADLVSAVKDEIGPRGNLTATVEEALRLWLSERQKQTAGEPINSSNN